MTTSAKYVECLSFTLCFPSGISAGAGSHGNRLLLARNGQGELVLRGSALAGVLRTAWRENYEGKDDDGVVTRFFGSSKEEGQASPLVVDDVVLDIGAAATEIRAHHLRNRHTGAVVEKALYFVEAAPPGTKANIALWLHQAEKPNDDFFSTLAALLQRGLVFGGSGNRGLGLAEPVGEFRRVAYDLTKIDDMAAFLEDRRILRLNGSGRQDETRSDKKVKESNVPLRDVPLNDDTLRIDFALKIPGGQDLLVSAGQGLDAESEPHKVRKADGLDYWMIPGSTLHGLFRNWYTRLVAREGGKVSDSVERYGKYGEATSEDIGWVFDRDRKDDKGFLNEIKDDYPVEYLFGSLHKKGRLHISDGFSVNSTTAGDIQYRKHVALDAISGGAIEHLLFDNYVLTRGTFHFTMLVREPEKEEVRRLVQTLRAIDLGLLRIGSSKSAGRLELAGVPKASGRGANMFMEEMERQNASKDVIPLKMEDSGDQDDSHSVTTRVGSFFENQKLDPKTRRPVSFPAVQLDDGNRDRIEIPAELFAKLVPLPSAKNKIEVQINSEGMIVGVAHIATVAAIAAASSRDAHPAPVRNDAGAQAFKRPFYNPYTFLPFTSSPDSFGSAKKPTPLTIDEKEPKRFTGVIELKIRSKSPLISSLAMSREEAEIRADGTLSGQDLSKKLKEIRHKHYQALTIGDDVIVPATGVRGFLRYLLTLVTGGPLAAIDREMFLCHGRNDGVQLSPLNRNFCLAEVVVPGNSRKPGKVKLGRTVLVRASDIIDRYNSILPRPDKDPEIKHLWAEFDEQAWKLKSVSDKKGEKHCWKVKLSGRPINPEGKKEGLFLASGTIVELPISFWQAYANRNRHGFRDGILKEGDLVWLELTESGFQKQESGKLSGISAKNILSIQWARWGRKGKSIMDETILPKHLRPEYLRSEFVSPVTDLFGMVPVKGSEEGGESAQGIAFAGRIRPGNLVFQKGAKRLTSAPMPLGVLASPHPGCLPFYRKCRSPETISQSDPLRGYKVYRTSQHAGLDDADAPWRFKNQGVYENGQLAQDDKQKVNFSAQLLREETEGTLQLSVRGLSMKELALLLKACSMPWRLGGGKPFGLGLCTVEVEKILNEKGNKVEISGDEDAILPEETRKRFNMWKAMQEPVELLRYPRASEGQENKGGMLWFKNFALPKKNGTGMQPVKPREGGEYPGWILPDFDPERPDADRLYGYDHPF